MKKICAKIILMLFFCVQSIPTFSMQAEREQQQSSRAIWRTLALVGGVIVVPYAVRKIIRHLNTNSAAALSRSIVLPQPVVPLLQPVALSQTNGLTRLSVNADDSDDNDSERDDQRDELFGAVNQVVPELPRSVFGESRIDKSSIVLMPDMIKESVKKNGEYRAPLRGREAHKRDISVKEKVSKNRFLREKNNDKSPLFDQLSPAEQSHVSAIREVNKELLERTKHVIIKRWW